MMKKQLLRATVLGCLVLSVATGCQTIDPNAVPVECIPPSESRTDKLKLNFLQLRQDPPKEYILAPGDVLGIYIEGITGSEDVPPPVHFPEDPASTLPPAVGFPIPIRDDGRISLP